MSNSLESHPWWGYIHEDLQELLKQSDLLIKITDSKIKKEDPGVLKFHDFSYMVFPAAKAYEGFLKNLFRDLGFISDEDFYGKRFRIGRALNPELEKYLRDKEGVYDKIVDYCGGRELANTLWDTWKKGRNLLFHWFPNEKNAIDFDEAKDIVEKIVAAMDMAFESCKVS